MGRVPACLRTGFATPFLFCEVLSYLESSMLPNCAVFSIFDAGFLVVLGSFLLLIWFLAMIVGV